MSIESWCSVCLVLRSDDQKYGMYPGAIHRLFYGNWDVINQLNLCKTRWVLLSILKKDSSSDGDVKLQPSARLAPEGATLTPHGG